MTTLERAIVATICYYDALDYPLTSWEVWRFLVNPFSLSRAEGAMPEESSLRAVRRALRSEKLSEYIRGGSGFYCLMGRENLFDKRIDRQTRAIRAWRRAERAARILRGVPFLRLVAGSGSLALSNMKRESDLDFFIITSARRIWTSRLLVVLLMHVAGIRRHGHKVANRVCLNHFITEDSLEIPHHTAYTAHLYSHLVPLINRNNALARFWQNNRWIEEFVAFPPEDRGLAHGRTIRESRFLRGWGRFWELVFSGFIGDGVEVLAKKLQLRWMRRSHSEPIVPKAHEGRVVISDRELAFHPGSPEIGILKKFERQLSGHNLIDIE